MAQSKKRWTFLPLLILPPVIFFLFGMPWAILSLGVVILFLVVYDLIYVNFLTQEARRRREIWKHMTFAERDQMQRMWYTARDWWMWTWVIIGFFPVSSTVVSILRITSWDHVFPRAYYSVTYLVLYAIVNRIIFEPRWRKRFHDFYYSTEYARQKGWHVPNPENEQ